MNHQFITQNNSFYWYLTGFFLRAKKESMQPSIPDAAECRGHYVAAASGVAAVLSSNKRAWRGGTCVVFPLLRVGALLAAAVALLVADAVVDFDGLVARWTIIIILARLLCSHRKL